MGVVKTHVQYNSLHTVGNSLYEIAGMQVKKELKEIFETDIPELYYNTYWRGKRYNLLVDEFNKFRPECQTMLGLIGVEIPSAIYAVAENYAKTDTDFQARSKNVLEDTSLPELPRGDDTALDFDGNKVEEVRSRIVLKFQKINESLNTYEAAFEKKDWTGSAAESFTAKLKETKGKIAEAFDNLSKQFSTLMQQTIEDMNSTENANTVGAGTTQSTGSAATATPGMGRVQPAPSSGVSNKPGDVPDSSSVGTTNSGTVTPGTGTVSPRTDEEILRDLIDKQ